MTTTIIGDIHGEAPLLRRLLDRIRPWLDAGDALVFVGDLIDRGPDNRGVVDIVRRLVDSGRAECLMGNHELNAVLYHRTDAAGQPLRARTARHTQQHAAFLRDYPVGAAQTMALIDWFAARPLVIDRGGLHIVHAQWCDAAIRWMQENGIGTRQTGLRLPPDWTDRWPHDPALRTAVKTLTQGREFDLPDGRFFLDKSGHKRTRARLAWWRTDPLESLADQIAGPRRRAECFADLPPLDLPSDPSCSLLPSFHPGAPVTVFGHYALEPGPPRLSHTAICVDATRAAGGPLTAWRSDGDFVQLE